MRWVKVIFVNYLRVKFSRYICDFISISGRNGRCMVHGQALLRPISFLLYICLKLIFLYLFLSLCVHLCVSVFLYVSLLSLYVSVFPILFQAAVVGLRKVYFFLFIFFVLINFSFSRSVSLSIFPFLFVSLCVYFSLCFCVCNTLSGSSSETS